MPDQYVHRFSSTVTLFHGGSHPLPPDIAARLKRVGHRSFPVFVRPSTGVCVRDCYLEKRCSARGEDALECPFSVFVKMKTRRARDGDRFLSVRDDSDCDFCFSKSNFGEEGMVCTLNINTIYFDILDLLLKFDKRFDKIARNSGNKLKHKVVSWK